MEPLYDRIDRCLVKSQFDGSDFLPQSSLDELITPESIAGELRSVGLDPTHSKFIFNVAKKVFTILVCIDMVAAIHGLLGEGFTDQHLPVDIDNQMGQGLVSCRSRKLFMSFAFIPWDRARCRQFRNNQWLVQSPVFTMDFQEVDLDGRCPLPVIYFEKNVHRGHFSVVHKVKLHCSHQRISNAPPVSITQALERSFRAKDIKVPGHEPYLALKELTLNETEGYAELEMLQTIRKCPTKHLIKAIAGFRRQQGFYFLFRWADGGNLREFWQRENPEPLNAHLILWVLRQMYGLAGALAILHNFSPDKFGRHGDLKPENILLFKGADDYQVNSPGILQISDVGLAKFHAARTNDRNVATDTTSDTQMYEPPETEISPHLPRSRKYDIWSIGCIYLEFVIWILRGFNELERFKNWRRNRFLLDERFKFYTITAMQNEKATEAEIHPEIRSWVHELYRDPRCRGNTALKDLLTLIDKKLLQIRIEDRINATELYQELSKIGKKIESKSYLFNEAAPPEGPLGPSSPSPLKEVVRNKYLVPPSPTSGQTLRPTTSGDNFSEFVRVSPPSPPNSDHE